MKKKINNGNIENNAKISKIQINLLKELNYLNNWLKDRNNKKLTNRAIDLLQEKKLIKNTSQQIKDKLEQHIIDKANILGEIIDRKINNMSVFNNFIKIIKPEFKGNDLIMKHIDETIKYHNIYQSDLKKAKDIINKIYIS
jgi:Mlc titration factor MtfA (ptsG expression regulator)